MQEVGRWSRSVASAGLAACAVACGSAGSLPGDPGRETGPCIDAECLGGDLVCLSDLCVDPNATPTTSGDTPESDGPSTDPTTPDESGETTSATPTTSMTSADESTCGEGECGCEPAAHEPCDDDSTDVFQAIGLNCPDEQQLEGSVGGNPAAIGLRTGFGSTDQWAPREGSKFAVIGSGFVAELDAETPQGDMDVGPTHCNDDVGAFDPGSMLPEPFRTNDVKGDCVADPNLLGTGDCSNTIAGQFNQGMTANDYAELRIVGTVPDGIASVSFASAFFSVEYPFYYGSAFNDMFVVWLESERWTGNAAFDQNGQPISLNAGFLDFRDDTQNLPEFAGTCMRQHAGTQWLGSTAPVNAGEDITLVFAIFDLSDSILDSFAFIDDVRWGCEGPTTPQTDPLD